MDPPVVVAFHGGRDEGRKDVDFEPGEKSGRALKETCGHGVLAHQREDEDANS